jgi:hypothetical protein
LTSATPTLVVYKTGHAHNCNRLLLHNVVIYNKTTNVIIEGGITRIKTLEKKKETYTHI